MQATYGTGQTEQWSWMVTQLWTWMWSGMSWIMDLQQVLFGFVLGGASPALTALKAALLLLPAAVLIVSLWAMMVSLYTLPFRSGRGYFLTALLMSWWDVGRMAWFYWAGMGRFLFVLVGWIGSLIKAAARLIWNTIKGALNSPFAVLDWTSRRYFQPGVPWLAFLLLLLWSAHRSHHLHVYAAADDERAARRPHRVRAEPRDALRAALRLPVLPRGRQLRLRAGAERRHQEQTVRNHHLDGAHRGGGGDVRGPVPLSRAGGRDHAVDGPAGLQPGHRWDAGDGFRRMARCPRHDLVPLRTLRHAGADRRAGPGDDQPRGASVDMAPPRQPEFWRPRSPP